jgi:hypothetical protein
MQLPINKLHPIYCQWLQTQFNDAWKDPGFELPNNYRYIVYVLDAVALSTGNKIEATGYAKTKAFSKVYDRKEKRFLFIA